jgi:hypothetical protein
MKINPIRCAYVKLHMKVVIEGWLWVLATLDSTNRGHPVFTAQELSSHSSQGTRRLLLRRLLRPAWRHQATPGPSARRCAAESASRPAVVCINAEPVPSGRQPMEAAQPIYVFALGGKQSNPREAAWEYLTDTSRNSATKFSAIFKPRSGWYAASGQPRLSLRYSSALSGSVETISKPHSWLHFSPGKCSADNHSTVGAEDWAERCLLLGA